MISHIPLTNFFLFIFIKDVVAYINSATFGSYNQEFTIRPVFDTTKSRLIFWFKVNEWFNNWIFFLIVPSIKCFITAKSKLCGFWSYSNIFYIVNYWFHKSFSLLFFFINFIEQSWCKKSYFRLLINYNEVRTPEKVIFFRVFIFLFLELLHF